MCEMGHVDERRQIAIMAISMIDVAMLIDTLAELVHGDECKRHCAHQNYPKQHVVVWNVRCAGKCNDT